MTYKLPSSSYSQEIPHFKIRAQNVLQNPSEHSALGQPLPSEFTVAAAAAASLQSCLTLCEPMDYSPPGSSVHGLLQARILE